MFFAGCRHALRCDAPFIIASKNARVTALVKVQTNRQTDMKLIWGGGGGHASTPNFRCKDQCKRPGKIPHARNIPLHYYILLGSFCLGSGFRVQILDPFVLDQGCWLCLCILSISCSVWKLLLPLGTWWLFLHPLLLLCSKLGFTALSLALSMPWWAVSPDPQPAVTLSPGHRNGS